MTEKPAICRGFPLVAVLVVAAFAALAVDVPVARTLRGWNQVPTTAGWLGFFDMFEMFGHGFGVLVLILAIHQLDPGRRWAIPRVLACALAAGAAANVLKMLVLRVRPYESALEGTVLDTFGTWLPIFDGGSAGQSFPSAHTATAVGFAVALTWLYPQGRLLFATLAALVGCQRVVCGAHYLSDVLIGAAAGWFVAGLFVCPGRLSTWFDRRETRWRSSSPPS